MDLVNYIKAKSLYIVDIGKMDNRPRNKLKMTISFNFQVRKALAKQILKFIIEKQEVHKN
jgi:hypothetical protein